MESCAVKDAVWPNGQRSAHGATTVVRVSREIVYRCPRPGAARSSRRCELIDRTTAFRAEINREAGIGELFG
jgi:hypothetical protein